jgi:hypothetical protein
MRTRPPMPTPPDVQRRRVWLPLSPSDLATLDARAHQAHRTRAGQVAADVAEYLPAVADVPEDGPGGTQRVDLPGDVLRAVEAAVGVERRSAAIAAAVQGANEKSRRGP